MRLHRQHRLAVGALPFSPASEAVMRNLMQPDALKLVAYVAGIIASPAVILAAVKAILFFGKLSNAVDRLIGFAEEATKTLGQHDTRIAVLEDRLEVPR